MKIAKYSGKLYNYTYDEKLCRYTKGPGIMTISTIYRDKTDKGFEAGEQLYAGRYYRHVSGDEWKTSG